MIVVLMGVSGAGKTTIGQRLARRLAWPFIDADDYHPSANVAKMAAGVALTDEDRWPWLDALNRRLREEHDAIVACSALKQAYRDRLLAGIADARVVFLHGSRALIAERLAERKHRYMPASLLDSQFATLERPAHAITVDVSGEPDACVQTIAESILR
jgi:gluconokinase